jgi:hypothetical protein
MPFLLMSRQCDQCLMNPGTRIVSSLRAAQILKDTARRDDWFICHKSPDGKKIACRGHHDAMPSQIGRIAGRLRAIVEIDPVTLAPVQSGES